MKLMKIETVGGAAVTANLARVIDITRVTDAIPAATTAVINYANAAGALKTVTFTVTGADDAEKLLNAQRTCDWFMGIVQELNGPASNQKGVYILGTHAGMTTAAGLTFTAATTEPLTTISFS